MRRSESDVSADWYPQGVGMGKAGTPRRLTPLVAATAPLLMILVAALGACAGDDPAAPDLPAPNIVGSYQGSWSYILAYAPAGGDQDLVCPGTLTVESQVSNGTFTGRWTQQPTSDDCDGASGTVSGIVESSGAITVVSLSSDGGGAGTTLEEVTGGDCVATRFDDAYRGSADGSTFEISYAISGDCSGDRAVSWVTAFSGVIAPGPSPQPSSPAKLGISSRVVMRGDCARKYDPLLLRGSTGPNRIRIDLSG